MAESYDLVFNVDGIASHFSAIPMPKDGSCLFRSLSSILTGSHIHHHRFRQAVIEHVGLNWTTFCALTAAPDGNNYASKDAYLLSMSLNETFGSYCELLAASQIFFLKFYVFYQDGSMNKIGDENYEQVGYLLFSGDLYSGHFDVLEPNSSEKNLSQSLNLSTIKKKRRCRVRNEIRVNQLNLAKKSYVQRKPEVNRRSVRNYTLKNPEVHQKSVKKYSSKNPEVNQKSVKKYAKKNPQMNRKAVKNYYREHPEIHLSSALKYQKKNPEKHLESMKKYAINNPEKISTSHVISNEKKRNEKNENSDPKYLSGFSYDPSFNYSADEVVSIGKMKHICNWCKALKWKDENPGMCCLNGKVSLPLPKELPEPLLSLVTGTHRDSEHFLSSLGKYNACFQMTSFGANEVTFENFRPTFKVQGQVYHLIGSLYPASYAKPSFLQIYFVGDEVKESDLRKDVCSGLKDDLLLELQKMLHLHNIYITEFKAVIDSFSENSDFKVVIRADRKPAGGHKGLYNEPTVGEVAAVIVGESFEPRDIVLHKRSDKITRISEINKGYDSLQYPLMFCFGEDGYSINIPMINPTTNSILKKTVSCKSFYAYKLMVRVIILRSESTIDHNDEVETTGPPDEFIKIRQIIDKELDVSVDILGKFTSSPKITKIKIKDGSEKRKFFGEFTDEESTIYINAWGDNIPQEDLSSKKIKFFNLVLKEYKSTKHLEYNSRSFYEFVNE
ncbi:uncharacterized protein [Bemisia tabaci]